MIFQARALGRRVRTSTICASRIRLYLIRSRFLHVQHSRRRHVPDFSHPDDSEFGRCIHVVVFVPNLVSNYSFVLICGFFVQVSSGDSLVKHDVTSKPALEVGSRSVRRKCCNASALLCCPVYGSRDMPTGIYSICIC